MEEKLNAEKEARRKESVDYKDKICQLEAALEDAKQRAKNLETAVSFLYNFIFLFLLRSLCLFFLFLMQLGGPVLKHHKRP